MTEIHTRTYDPAAAARLVAAGIPPLLARIYAARGVRHPTQLQHDLAGLAELSALKNVDRLAQHLADAIHAQENLLIIADYDADGATACAVGLRALRSMGARVDYLVPNRFEYGYGLTPEIVRLAAQKKPDVLITVDNGIASHAGIDEAHRLGLRVWVTDHHLPADTLPEADIIVNPNQPGCAFSSKHLAGVGVMFYVMLALRAELRRRGAFANSVEPNLARLLDIVALGTVADVVVLDDNNRILVRQGLARIRHGKACAGIQALYQVAARDMRRASAWDLGFMLGPRLNAAGRLTDMSLGIELLITDDASRAAQLAHQLDALNRERRSIEAEMQDSAILLTETIAADACYSLSLFDATWHPGVIGILASRLKDKFHRPVIAFARGDQGELKGSGRSIPGFHLRDALDLVSKRHPNLLKKFGGHAMAAGLTLAESDLVTFREAFEAVAATLLTPALLARALETDGSLPQEQTGLDTAQALAAQVWGQGFPEPQFVDRFQVKAQRIVSEKHTKLRLLRDAQEFDAMLFYKADILPDQVDAVYRLDINEYQGRRSVQLILQHWVGITG